MQHMIERAHLPRLPCYLDYVGCSQLYRILPSTDYTQGRSQTVDLLEPEWIQYHLEPYSCTIFYVIVLILPWNS